MHLYKSCLTIKHVNPNIHDTCFKCKDQKGTLFHCMWECQKILSFCRKVLDLTSQIIGEEVPVSPKLCLLNLYPEDFTTSKKVRSLLNICFLEAKRCIALSWKSDTPCATSQWLRGMTSYLALEKISYTTKNRLEFWKIWNIFYHFLENNMDVDGWMDKVDGVIFVLFSFKQCKLTDVILITATHCVLWHEHVLYVLWANMCIVLSYL